MTSYPGNKIVAGGFCLLLVTLLFLFGEFLSERKLKVKLYEKQYTQAVSALEEKNSEVKNEVY